MPIRVPLSLAAILAGGLWFAPIPRCFAQSATAAPVKHPNVIFILTDDMGFGDLGVLFQNARRAANDPHKPWELTPHLDKFAAEGVTLRDHYCAAPVCAPSRASILLGVSQGHANVRDNQFDKALEDNHTLATVLRQAGYATVAVGKWGLQGASNRVAPPAACAAPPAKRGFDEFFGYLKHSDGHEHYPKESPYVQHAPPPRVWWNEHDVTDGLDRCYTADLWTAWTKRWIVNHEKTKPGQPFFIYLAYDTPHAAIELPAQPYPAGGGLSGGLQWLGKPGRMINTAVGHIDSWYYPEFRNAMWRPKANPDLPREPWPDVEKRYATSIRRIDDSVGDIIQLLRDLRIDDDTLVIFTSDNGPSIESYLPKKPITPVFFESYGPFDGIKRDCLEGGVRMPTLVRWPGHVLADKVVTRPSISYDWMPTLANAAGLPAPARSDGVSLIPELTGHGTQRDRGYVYVEYFNDGKTPSFIDFTPSNRGRLRNQMQAIRIGPYAGLRYDIKSANDPFEIFDVTADPKESRDLAPAMPGLAARMHDLVLQVRRPNASAPRPYDTAPVPAVQADHPVQGVEWHWFDGDFPWVPASDGLAESAHGREAEPAMPATLRSRPGALVVQGFVDVPRGGNYTFTVHSDMRTLLRIHDATVIDADYGHRPGEDAAGTIDLAAGLHPFRLSALHPAGAGAQLDLTWTAPGATAVPIPANHLLMPAPTMKNTAPEPGASQP